MALIFGDVGSVLEEKGMSCDYWHGLNLIAPLSHTKSLTLQGKV